MPSKLREVPNIFATATAEEVQIGAFAAVLDSLQDGKRTLVPQKFRCAGPVYIPDLPAPAYQNLLESLEEEFTYGIGGCTIQRGLSGSYLSNQGVPTPDRINLIYTILPYSLTGHLPLLSVYADELREAAFRALNEEKYW